MSTSTSRIPHARLKKVLCSWSNDACSHVCRAKWIRVKLCVMVLDKARQRKGLLTHLSRAVSVLSWLLSGAKVLPWLQRGVSVLACLRSGVAVPPWLLSSGTVLSWLLSDVTALVPKVSASQGDWLRRLPSSHRRVFAAGAGTVPVPRPTLSSRALLTRCCRRPTSDFVTAVRLGANARVCKRTQGTAVSCAAASAAATPAAPFRSQILLGTVISRLLTGQGQDCGAEALAAIHIWSMPLTQWETSDELSGTGSRTWEVERVRREFLQAAPCSWTHIM